MKTCSKCKVEKLLTEFNYKTGRNLQPWCRVCSRAESRRHYKANRKAYISKQKKRNQINRGLVYAYVNDLKSKTPCKDCGKYYPYYVMDFDHLSDKLFEISKPGEVGYNMVLIKKEIDKCEIVCSNCHRERTYNRRKAEVV